MGEGAVEDLAAGLAVNVLAEPTAAVFSDSRRRLTMPVSVDCHRTWIRSAQTVLLPGGMSVCVTVSREGEVGSGPGDSIDVEKTFARSVPMRLAQAKSTNASLVVESTKYELKASLACPHCGVFWKALTCSRATEGSGFQRLVCMGICRRTRP